MSEDQKKEIKPFFIDEKQDKAVDVSDQYNTHEICEKFVSREFILLKYCSDRHKTQKMCDKAADACFSALKFIPDWLVTTKMLGILNNVL